MSTHIQPSEGMKMRLTLANKIKFNELAAGQHTLAGMSTESGTTNTKPLEQSWGFAV